MRSSAGERLLGIVHADTDGAGFRRILHWGTSIERRCSLVEGPVAVPMVGNVFGSDHHGSSGGLAGVGVFIRGAHGKFLNAIGREIL